MTRRILFFYVLFFFNWFSYSQGFDPRIEKSTLTINHKACEGYQTKFDIPAKKLEKAWWRYSREFGRPLNMKGYYQVTIPSHLNSGNVDLDLLSKCLANKKGSTFFLTIDEEGIPQSKKSAYMSQVQVILQTFKVNYFVSELGEKLEDLEKRAATVSKRVAKSSGNSKQKHLSQLQKLEDEIQQVKEQLTEVNDAY